MSYAKGKNAYTANLHTLEADDQRKRELGLLACGNDAVGNGSAINNTAENVHKNALDLLVRRDDLEGLGHLLVLSACVCNDCVYVILLSNNKRCTFKITHKATPQF